MDEEEEQEDRFMNWGLAVELALLLVIAKRFRSIDEATTYVQTRMWCAEDMAEIERLLGKARASVAREAAEAVSKDKAKAWAKPYYEGKAVSKVAESVLDSIEDTAKKQARQTAEDYLRTSVLGIVGDDGEAYPIRDAYLQLADQAIRRIKAGEPNHQVIAGITEGLAQKGVRVRYASGATRELYSALSMNVMDGYREAMHQQRDALAADFGADGYEVSAHSLCAPDHLEYQGKQYSFAAMERIQRKLSRPIAQGKNCRHRLTKVKLGIHSARTPEELKEIRERSTRPVHWYDLNGKKHEGTAYDFSQAQRAMEQRIRQQRMTSKLLDGDTKKLAEQREKELIAHYNQQCRGAKVATRPDRWQIYNLS